MKLWLDADAAPREVKEVCYRASERLQLETILVANMRLQLPVGHAHLHAVRVEGGPDVADRYIAEHAEAGDVAVTADTVNPERVNMYERWDDEDTLAAFRAVANPPDFDVELREMQVTRFSVGGETDPFE